MEHHVSESSDTSHEVRLVALSIFVAMVVIVAGGVATALAGTTAGLVAVGIGAVCGIGALAGSASRHR